MGPWGKGIGAGPLLPELGVDCVIFTGPHKWCPRRPWGRAGTVVARNTDLGPCLVLLHCEDTRWAGGRLRASLGLHSQPPTSQVMTAARSQACRADEMAPHRPHSRARVCICGFWGGARSKHSPVPAGHRAMSLLSGASHCLQGWGAPTLGPVLSGGDVRVQPVAVPASGPREQQQSTVTLP